MLQVFLVKMFLLVVNLMLSVVFLSLVQQVHQREQHAVVQVMLPVKIVILLIHQLVQHILQLQASLHLNLLSMIVISKHGKLLPKTVQG